VIVELDFSLFPRRPYPEYLQLKIFGKKALLKINQKSLLAAGIRKELADHEFRREATSKRAAIEGTISAIKRGRGPVNFPSGVR